MVQLRTHAHSESCVFSPPTSWGDFRKFEVIMKASLPVTAIKLESDCYQTGNNMKSVEVLLLIAMLSTAVAASLGKLQIYHCRR